MRVFESAGTEAGDGLTRDCLDPLVISRLRASFSSIVSTEHGRNRLTTTFYATLFAEHPEFRALFPAALDQQGHRLFQALQFVIDNLDDEGRVLGFLSQLGRDHRKYGVEGRHYFASGNALLVAVQSSFTQAIWTPSLTAAWTELLDLLLHTMADAADTDDLPAAWGATVVDHERRLDDLAIVRLETDSPIPYGAGQYLSVQIPQRPRMWRYLSAAIPANPYGQLEFHVRRVSGGWVSPAIVNETQVGDRWLLSSPLGGLEVDRDSGQDVLMIGSGTGIAPLRAQVMEMAMRSNNPRVHMFVGGKYPCDLYDIETLWHLSLSNPWLTVVPVSEEDEDPWWHTIPAPEAPPGLHQRLQGRLGRVVARFGSWADRQIQISGSPAMIKTTVYALQCGGTPPELIRHDPLI
ncbi:globin domain-containing protein [Rhodococcus opacus]|uniref:globin domain-containing protein n=1 Tax=Rhodococcus opacus TaxID=37919 RepID=UPI002952FDE6|nr:globin domain-containing protein [Rhodococcus opacus]MDV7090986.1 globin domain-containing protein [Rhodococcus opacus]